MAQPPPRRSGSRRDASDEASDAPRSSETPSRGGTQIVDSGDGRGRVFTQLATPQDDVARRTMIAPEPVRTELFSERVEDESPESAPPETEAKPRAGGGRSLSKVKADWSRPEAPPPASPAMPAAELRAERQRRRRDTTLRPTSASLPTVDDVIEDRYRIVRPIGVGGMGHVFLAHHVRLDKPVAIKVLSPEVLVHGDGMAQKRRFLIEGRAASRLEHPGIVDVTDFGTTESGLPFMAMEYLEGEDLSDRICRGDILSWEESLGLILEVLEALAAAHDQGVVHRDVKPENCFVAVSPTTGEAKLKLLDFGIAKVITDVDDTIPVTQRGELLGTPQYMSPEQALGEPVDVRSDIYAVGVLLYELTTGEPPFNQGTPMEVVAHQIKTPPPPLFERVYPDIGVPAGADAVLAKALAKDPADRYPDANAMADALRSLDSAPAVLDRSAATSKDAMETSGRTHTLAVSSRTNTIVAAATSTSDASMDGFETGRGGWRWLVALLLALGLAAALWVTVNP